MEIVCTIGPATFSHSMVRMLWCAGVTVFRLNLSHTQTLNEVGEFIKMVKAETDGKMCLDTHGMKFCSANKSEPFFTRFDEEVLSATQGIDQVAVSFARSAKAVKEARRLSPGAHIVAKLEDCTGLRNRTEVIAEADTVLIDRGDLSRSVPVKEIPKHCREIIRTCEGMKKPVWVATNLLESMVLSPQPTLGEVNDVATLAMLGVDGLVLAAETAIGNYPIQCVEFVREMAEMYGAQDK
jgi:pyruvate kinase